MEQRNFWLTFLSSAFGGTIFALATIPPASAVSNLTGWLQLISGLRIPVAAGGAVTSIAIIAAVLTLVASLLSVIGLRMGNFPGADKALADMFKHAGRR